jgi:hypothetical protein
MKKKKISISIVIILVLALSGASVLAIANQNIRELEVETTGEAGTYMSAATLYDFGQLHRDSLERHLDFEFSINGKTIYIPEEKIKHLAKGYELVGFNAEIAYDLAFDEITRTAILYATAISFGYTISDSEVQAEINREIERMKEADNFDEFIVFFEAAQMTVEEYMQSRFEQFRKGLIIADFLESRIYSPNNVTIIDGFSNSEDVREINEQQSLRSDSFESLVYSLKQNYEISIL